MKYITRTNIRLNGKRILTGKKVEIDTDNAKGLLASGAIKKVGKNKSADKDSNLVKADPSVKLSEVVTAIGNLDKEEAENWTQSGAPKVEKLTEILGVEIKVEQRDAAWEEFNAN